MARKSSASRKASSGGGDGEHRVIATNRRARHDFHILDRVEAGLVLTGSEVKSIRTNGATIREGFGQFRGEELWLQNVHISQLPQASYLNHEPTRPRKCLMRKRELRKLADAVQSKGLTIVPLTLYFKGVRVKVELALARGRRKGDRRENERAMEDRRQIREYTGR